MRRPSTQPASGFKQFLLQQLIDEQHKHQNFQLTVVIIITWSARTFSCCSFWSKNIHSTWYQQFKGFVACKGIVAPGFLCVSKTRYVPYDNMAHLILHNSSLIGDFLNKIIWVRGKQHILGCVSLLGGSLCDAGHTLYGVTFLAFLRK